MIDKNILEERVSDKLNLLTLHAMVNEAFISALPFDQNNLSVSDRQNLGLYSLKVLESLGGPINIFANAYDNKNLTAAQETYLTNMASVCMEAANTAAKRIVKETDCKNATDLSGLVDKAALTDTEYTKFVKEADTITPDELSDTIKQKTLDVIKDEKNAYAREEQVEQDLQTAIQDTDSAVSESLSGYMDIILEKKDARSHVSFFSKLQASAFENLIYSNEKYGEIPFKVLEAVTFNDTFDSLHREMTPSECLESVVAISSQPTKDDVYKDKLMQTASLCSMIVYTLIETLRTMNLYSPSRNDISKIVDSQSDIQDKMTKTGNDVIGYTSKALDQVQVQSNKTSSIPELSNIITSLSNIKSALVQSSYSNESFMEGKTKILDKINTITGDINTKISSIGKESMTEAPQPTHNEMFKSNYDIAEFNKVYNICKNKPGLEQICMVVDPDDEKVSTIYTSFKNDAGQEIGQSTINLLNRPATESALSFVKDSISKSTLNTVGKPIYFSYDDGTGKKYPVINV